MSKDVLLMLVGGFVALLPFMGFPHSWDTVLLVCAGVVVVLLGVAVRRAKRRSVRRPFDEVRL